MKFNELYETIIEKKDSVKRVQNLINTIDFPFDKKYLDPKNIKKFIGKLDIDALSDRELLHILDKEYLMDDDVLK